MYEDVLKKGLEVGASHASDSELMAMFCDSTIQLLCGAVSPKLVWEGAQNKGMTSLELAEMANNDPSGVAELMWI